MMSFVLNVGGDNEIVNYVSAQIRHLVKVPFKAAAELE